MTHVAATRSTSVRSFQRGAALADESVTDRTHLCRLLSERLLADYPAACREALLGQRFEGVRFVQQSVTLLCCDPTGPDWSTEDLGVVTRRLGGQFEHFWGIPLFRFADPQAALQVALLLQETCRRPIRAALLTCEVTVAELELSGEPTTIALGVCIEAALALMHATAPGSIQVCPDSYRAMAGRLDRHSRNAIVTAEFEGDEVTSAFITPTPSAGSAYSTFAGLGAA
jgi:hypothetical protein